MYRLLKHSLNHSYYLCGICVRYDSFVFDNIKAPTIHKIHEITESPPRLCIK